jgi:hypothetical protein
LNENSDRFNAIVMFDVLHHIFVTEHPLDASAYFDDALDLFRDLRNALHDDGIIIVSETPRHGLRPFLKNKGLLQSNLNYKTKQEPSQWLKAFRKAGFRLLKKRVYVPYALRQAAFFLDSPLGLYTASDRLYFFLEKTDAA